jgi:two-component system, sensor histidine kinase
MSIVTSNTDQSTDFLTVADKTIDEDAVVTDTLFREKFIEHVWYKELGIFLIEAVVPLIIFHAVAEWRWLLFWEALWFTSAVWRILIRRTYRKRYPWPNLPRDPRVWSFVRHGYHAYTWFVVGLLGLFCFRHNDIAWVIIAVTGLCMLYTLAPSDAVEQSEIITGAVTLPLPVVTVLLIKGESLHLSLAAMMVGFIVMLATWGAQQVGARRNEIFLRMALQKEKLRAEEASVAKSRFIAAASHDLRQPLHALVIFVEALKAKIQRPDERTLVNNIENSVQALDGLFNALLDISKLDAGIVVSRPINFSLDKLLFKLSAEYRGQALAKGLGWRCECPSVVVHTDPILLETVIRNFISNAIRYTADGAVHLQCCHHEGEILLSVADTGIGIPIEKQQAIFQEFIQLHNPERDRNKGLGLGLSIVERLTNLLNLKLKLVSTPGSGSTFSLLIPASDASTMSVIPTESCTTLQANSLQGKIILVIDDDPNILEAMRVLLEGWQSLPILADSEATAVDHLNGPDALPDMLIVDFRLRDGVRGTEVIRRLRAHINHSVPAIIVTGDTAPERLQEVTTAGFLLLHKPVKPAKLRLAIQHLLK